MYFMTTYTIYYELHIGTWEDVFRSNTYNKMSLLIHCKLIPVSSSKVANNYRLASFSISLHSITFLLFCKPEQQDAPFLLQSWIRQV